jgi:hypothetical protein
MHPALLHSTHKLIAGQAKYVRPAFNNLILENYMVNDIIWKLYDYFHEFNLVGKYIILYILSKKKYYIIYV